MFHWARFVREPIEGVVDERSEIPTVDKFVGSFASGVVAAAQHLRVEVHATLAKFGGCPIQAFCWLEWGRFAS